MIRVGFAEELVTHSLAMGVMILAWGKDSKSLVKAAIIWSLIFGLIHLISIAEDPSNISLIKLKLSNVVFGFLLSMGFAGLVYQTNTIWIAVVLHGYFDVMAGNVGGPAVIEKLFYNWSLVNGLVAILNMLPLRIFGYWLLVKGFDNSPMLE